MTVTSQRYDLRRARDFQVLFVVVMVTCIMSGDRMAFRIDYEELFSSAGGFSIGESKAGLTHN